MVAGTLVMARHDILRVLLEAGEDFVKIIPGELDQKSGKGTHVVLDRSKVALKLSDQ